MERYAASGRAYVDWISDDDPAAPNGEPASELDHWEFRYRPTGGTWAAVITDSDEFSIGSATTGQSYDVEIKAVDSAGNVSAAATATLAVPPAQPWTQTETDQHARDNYDVREEKLNRPYDPNGYDAPEGPAGGDPDTVGEQDDYGLGLAASGDTRVEAPNGSATALAGDDRFFRLPQCTARQRAATPGPDECESIDPWLRSARRREVLSCPASTEEALDRGARIATATTTRRTGRPSIA